MKPIDGKTNCYAEYNVDSNEKDPRFKVGDHVKISKYKKFFTKGYPPNWSEEAFIISKIKNTIPWICVISDLKGKETVGTFYEKELVKTNKKQFKRKGDKLYVKWKVYSNSFNSLFDKKDLV